MHVRIVDYQNKLKLLSLVNSKAGFPILKSVLFYTENDFTYAISSDGNNFVKVQFSSRILEEGSCLIDLNLITLMGDVLEIEGEKERISISTKDSVLQNNTMLVDQYPTLNLEKVDLHLVQNLNLFVAKAAKVLGKEKDGKQYLNMSLSLDKGGLLLNSCSPRNIYQVFLDDVSFNRKRVVHLDAFRAKLLSDKNLTNFQLGVGNFSHFVTQDIHICVTNEGTAQRVPKIDNVGTLLFSKPDKEIINTLKAAQKVSDLVILGNSGDELVVEAKSASTIFTKSLKVDSMESDFSNVIVNVTDFANGLNICGLTDVYFYDYGGHDSLMLGNVKEKYITAVYK